MRLTRIVLIGLSLVLLLGLMNFWPTFFWETSDMHRIEGETTTVFYQQEEAAARQVFQTAESRAPEINQLLDTDNTLPIEIYIYDRQTDMQTKKYGRIGPLLGLDWYIGDNVKDRVLLTSPADTSSAHESATIVNAVLHELVHAYNHRINPKMSYWLDNGLAGYLSDQVPGEDLLRRIPIPSLEETKVSGPLAPLRFADMGGYEYSYTYIEFLDHHYDWSMVVELAKTGDFVWCFGVDEAQVYQEWVRYLNERPSQAD